MLALILCGSLLVDSGQRRYEIMLASVIVISVGHIGYTWVPGLGPHAWPALTFKHALAGGVWWGRVRDAVSAAGAQLDIFPSLHTGLSMTVGLHVLRYRRQQPFTLVWPITTFFVANIIVATVFLRWHYGVDLIAGALLAICAQRIAIVAYRHEGHRELDHARQSLWERLPCR
jgi:membrane-associated phospholipid phosphatase